MSDQDFRDFLAAYVVLEDEPAPLRSKGAEIAVADAFDTFDQVRMRAFASPSLNEHHSGRLVVFVYFLSFLSPLLFLFLSFRFPSKTLKYGFLVIGVYRP